MRLSLMRRLLNMVLGRLGDKGKARMGMVVLIEGDEPTHGRVPEAKECQRSGGQKSPEAVL